MIFGLFKKKNNDKEAEATASLINDEFDKFLKLGKLKSVIKLKDFKAAFKDRKLKFKKNIAEKTDEIHWSIESNGNRFDFLLNKFGEDIMKGGLQCMCTDFDCQITIINWGTGKKDKQVMAGADNETFAEVATKHNLDQSKPLNIKKWLIIKHGFVDMQTEMSKK